MANGKFYNGHMWAHSVEDLPPGTHYVIIEFSSVYVPGDQRSRECPGHGYGPHTEQKAEVIVFETKEAWENEIRTRVVSPSVSKNWVPLVAKVPVIETTISTKID